MYLLPDRADAPLDVERLVIEALESASRSYAMAAQAVMQFGDNSAADNELCVLLAQAQAAHNQMLATLSTMRHPSGAR